MASDEVIFVNIFKMATILAQKKRYSSHAMSFSLAGKKLPYFANYDFKEQTLR